MLRQLERNLVIKADDKNAKDGNGRLTIEEGGGRGGRGGGRGRGGEREKEEEEKRGKNDNQPLLDLVAQSVYILCRNFYHQKLNF